MSMRKPTKTKTNLTWIGNSEPVSEAEDEDCATSSTREQENLNASDGGVGSYAESHVDGSTDE
jgi:hypothetical protein